MSHIDLLLVSQSNVVDYDGYADLPLDRLDLYDTLVYPRMVHYEGKFRGHLDYLNHKESFDNDLNHMSIRRFLGMVGRIPSLAVTMLELRPAKFRSLALMTRVPFVRELVTGFVVCRLEKIEA